MRRFETSSDSFDDFPQFRTAGKHDTGEYYAHFTNFLTDLGSAAEMNCLITNCCKGTCSWEFPDKQLLIICLIICEIEASKGINCNKAVSNTKQLWFEQTLQKKHNKQNA